jgi:hypothetical protein
MPEMAATRCIGERRDAYCSTSTSSSSNTDELFVAQKPLITAVCAAAQNGPSVRGRDCKRAVRATLLLVTFLPATLLLLM